MIVAVGTTLETTTTGGRLRGREHPDVPGVVEFLGVPYATARRWGPPHPAPGWAGVRDATAHGPIAPQLPSPGARVMGARPDIADQSEQCLSLVVRTPAADQGRRPVLVWIHGGAYVEGAGSFGFYDAARLVAEGDVVVINVNYRLGVLGFLREPGLAAGNHGLSDLLAALDWVRREVAAFGGDPEQITVGGHSAGAHAAASLVGEPTARPGVQRLILQSGQFGLPPAAVEEAARTARFVREALAELAPGADPREVEVPTVLEAQRRALRRAAGPGGLNSVPPLCPVAGVDPVADPATWRAAPARAGVDVLVGATEDEAETFVAINPVGRRWRTRPVVGPLVVGGISRRATRRVFTAPAEHIADEVARGGARAYSYRVTAPGARFGACHAFELPFLFGRREPWGDAPMLEGLDWDRDVEPVGRAMRAAWLGFVRDGDPAGVDGGPWAPHVAGAGPTKHLAAGPRGR